MKTTLYFLILCISSVTISIAQTTYVPDDNFEQALIDLNIDVGPLDDYVNTANIQFITDLDMSNKNISSLEGIEDFESLIAFDCSNNQLTNLDISQNTGLSTLYCSLNNLTSLNVSQNILLDILDCSGNQIQNLDLSQNTLLTTLDCTGNQLSTINLDENLALNKFSCNANQITNLDLSLNILLTEISCTANLLTSIDLTNNTALEILLCSQNQLNSINLTNNNSLEELFCSNNELTTLNFNSSVKRLYCQNNTLTSLNLNQNTELIQLFCSNNQLNTLNVKNGNNTNMIVFNASNNPNLSCIEVDNITYSTSNWTNIDAQTVFSEDCSSSLTYVPDDNFEQVLIDLGYDSGPLDDYVPTNMINVINSLTITNENISDLTGIQDFESLQLLDLSNNQITTLNLSENTSLSEIYAANNNLVILNLNNGNTDNFNEIITTNNPNLLCIEVYDADYATESLSDNIDSQTNYSEDCSNIQTYVPDDNFEQALILLNLHSGPIDDYIPTDNIEAVTSLFLFDLNIADLTGIEDFVALTTLNCSSNNLTFLDLSQNIALTGLNSAFNELTNLDISLNTELTALFCSNNQLETINVKNDNNTNFNVFDALNNPNLTCIEVDDVDYSEANWTSIDSQTSFSLDCSEDPTDNNYTCSNAEAIIVEVDSPNTIFLNNALAGSSTLSSCDASNEVYFDVWYSFTMPLDGNLRITEIDGIDRITIYESCGGEEIQCFTFPNFVYNLDAGDYILRYATLEVFAGPESFTIQAYDIAANDFCANAETITVETASPTTVMVNNAMATESTEASCDTAEDDYLDVWYTFTMPIDGNLRLTGIDGVDRITIYEATCAGSEIICFTFPNFAYNLDAGEYILRYSTFDLFAGPASFTIQAFDIASNDECANAETITLNTETTTLVSLNNAMATESTEASCDTADDDYLDLWYKFTLQEDSDIQITGIDGTDRITMYEESCSGDEIVCFTFLDTVENLPAGDYILRYATYDFFAGPRGLNINITETLGIENTNNSSLKAAIFPTITEGLITIKLNDNIEQIKVQIVDINGREVYKKWHKKTASTTLQLNIANFSKGLYFITFSNATIFETKKVILK